MITFIFLSLAGGVGAGLRFVLDSFIKNRSGSAFPIGTTVINVSGSLLLGLVSGLALGQLLTETWHLVLGTGFLGGYTTFSTASFETVRLAQSQRYRAAAFNAFGMLALSLICAGFGLWLGLLV